MAALMLNDTQIIMQKNIINNLQIVQQIEIMQFEETEQFPVLLFLLEHNKFNQIIRAMLNENVSNTMLSQYGHSVKSTSSAESFKINRAVGRFTIRQVHFNLISSQLIQLKGSSQERAKQYENEPLLQTIRKKILTEIPSHDTRKTLWVQFTQIYEKPHFYNNLKELQLAPQFQTSIKKDINRTFKSPEVKAKTQQVLGVFAQYNPYIGYCQGMNSIIAFLIDDGFTCEEAFFIFKKVTQNLLPCDYYNSMDSIMAYMRIFYEMLNVTHPQCYAKLRLIAKEMENSYVAMVSFVLQWFVCLFSNQNVNIAITRVVWDFFLIEGITALFKAGLAMFDFLQPHILQCYSYESYNDMQKKYLKTITDANHIRNSMINSYISPQLLFILKQKLTQQDEQSKKQQDKKRPPKISDKKCNKKWNVCFQVLDNNLQNHQTYDYFVFKPVGEINLIDNYVQKLHQQYFNKQKIRPANGTDQLMIGRIQHICHSEEDVITQDSASVSQKNSQELASKQSRKKYTKSLNDPKSPIKWAQESIRKKAAQKIEQAIKKKSGMERSQSIIFMQKMVQNVSISNLLQLYEVDEMFQ